MSLPPLHHLGYAWQGQRERIVAIGEGKPVFFLAPLFEEANRTRRLLLEAMRLLAARGCRCYLPDLPGTLESRTPLSRLGWADWRDAAQSAFAACGGDAHIAAIRGGALLDGLDGASSHWRFSPASGASLFRDLLRIRMAADREAGEPRPMAMLEAAALATGIEVAGYSLSGPFLDAMKAAQPDSVSPCRTIRLESDAQPADAYLAGQTLWRRAEPGEDPSLSQLIARDIAEWIAACGAG